MAKLSGQTGAELWRRQDIPADGGHGARFVLDSAGDVIAAGFVQPAGRRNDLSIVKLAASTGDILWSQTAAWLPRRRQTGEDLLWVLAARSPSTLPEPSFPSGW
jgi:hypothetical protein